MDKSVPQAHKSNTKCIEHPKENPKREKYKPRTAIVFSPFTTRSFHFKEKGHGNIMRKVCIQLIQIPSATLPISRQGWGRTQELQHTKHCPDATEV